MRSPTVSITLATYNRTEFLQGTLDSLVAQTYQDFEIILVDDGSTDNTPQHIEQLLKNKKYAKVRFFPLPENRGIAFAISYAMQHSKGKYISHIGSDDLWQKTALEKMVQVLDTNSEVGVVYTDASRIDRDGKILSESRFAENPIGPQKGWVFKDLLLKGMFVSAISVTFRRSLYDIVGDFDTNYSISNDYDFFMRCSAHAQFDYINEVLACWRMHDKNLHKKDKTQAYIERIAVIQKNYMACGKEFHISELRYRTIISSIYLQTGIFKAQAGDFAESRPYFIKSLMFMPVNILAFVLFFNTYLKLRWLWHFEIYKKVYLRMFK